MSFGSLRTKIFLVLVAILATVAGFVMVFTQNEVEQAIFESEERAAVNVVDLLALDISVRYETLLRDKVETIRSRRRQLEEFGQVVRRTLDTYAQLAKSGAVSREAARGMALSWMNGMSFAGRYVFAYDQSWKALAYPDPAKIGQDLFPYRDFKGQSVVGSMWQDATRFGHAFSTYRWPSLETGALVTSFGYFGHHREWDLVFVVVDNSSDVEADVQAKLRQIEAALVDTLGRLTIAKEGFAFIFDGSGRDVAPPPPEHADLLRTPNLATGIGLREELIQAWREGWRTSGVFVPAGDPGAGWETRVSYFKALDWHIAAVVPRADLEAPARALIHRQGLVFAGLLVVVVALAYALAGRITRPLNDLAAYAWVVPTMDLTAPADVPKQIAALPDRYRDEVGRLAETLIRMDGQLRENVARMMNEAASRERMESELAIAREIQLGLLPGPEDALPAGRAIDMFPTMIAAKEVGGDLYDYFVKDGRLLCFAIGDVSGKGVPAALFMGITRTLLRAAAEAGDDPAGIMVKVNEGLCRNNPNMMFVTLFLGVLDLGTGELRYANAGHPPPFRIAPDGAIDCFKGLSGPACGVAEGVPYRTFSAVMARGETLFGFSDGVTDATDPGKALFGEDRTRDCLAREAAPTAEWLVRRLLADIDGFVAGSEQADDITILSLRFLGPEGRAPGAAAAVGGAMGREA